MKMPHRKAFSIKTLSFSRLLLRHLNSSKSFRRTSSFNTRPCHKYSSIAHRTDLHDHALVFNVEETLLKSDSLFPYFMLVAFEAGSLLRAFLLLILYPVLCMLGYETGLKMMVFVSFFGIKKNSFRVGSAVLPKFLLEGVGFESYEVLRRARTKVAVTNLPLVMVDSFLRDYLEMEHVVGRDLKVFCGYFVGLMAEQEQDENKYDKVLALDEGVEKIGIRGFHESRDHPHQLFSSCKDMYLVRGEDKRNWRQLPREKYPKQLVFHDGRLALTPTPLAALAIFMWVPVGLLLSIIRIILSITLPYHISGPILAFTGLRLTLTEPKTENTTKTKGLLYVCNHRTLLDPMYLCFALKKDFTAVTYSLSRISEILAPIRTVRLTRNRDQDGEMMGRLLDQGDLVVCPEGTTCREPYLLRFSPLFAEMSENIVPVAMDTWVEMFHGTTAGGFKGLDPVFFLMNPTPTYAVTILDPVSTCRDGEERSRFDVANQVQRQLGEVLAFECTKLTRRDKYLILAGNEGVVNCPTKTPAR